MAQGWTRRGLLLAGLGAAAASAGGCDPQPRPDPGSSATPAETLPGDLLATLSPVHRPAWSPDGFRIATAGAVGQVFIDNGTKPSLTLAGHTDLVSDVAFSHENTFVTTASYDGTARNWSAREGVLQQDYVGHSSGLNVVAWSPVDLRFATGSSDGTARIWVYDARESLHTLRGRRDGIIRLAWSPDGTRLLTLDGDALVWDTATGRLVHAVSEGEGFYGAWSPDATRVAVTGGSDTTRVWDARTGAQVHALTTDAAAMEVAWSPDGRMLATAHSGGPGTQDGSTARIWDADSGTLVHALTGHAASVYEVEWSPDGRRIATGSDDHTVRLWDVDSGAPIPVVGGYLFGLSAAWSPKGNQIACQGPDNVPTVRVFRV